MFSYQHARDPKFNIWSEFPRSSEEALFTFAFYPFSIVSRFEIKLPEFICVTWQKVEKKRRSSGIGVAVEDCEGNSKAFKSLSPPSK